MIMAIETVEVVPNLSSGPRGFVEEAVGPVAATRVLVNGSETLVIAVRDTGIGTMPERLDRSFGNFSHADRQTARETPEMSK